IHCGDQLLCSPIEVVDSLLDAALLRRSRRTSELLRPDSVDNPQYLLSGSAKVVDLPHLRRHAAMPLTQPVGGNPPIALPARVTRDELHHTPSTRLPSGHPEHIPTRHIHEEWASGILLDLLKSQRAEALWKHEEAKPGPLPYSRRTPRQMARGVGILEPVGV